jgi:hypothetical protein
MLYLTCAVYPQPQSLVLTSPSSSTGNRQQFFIITAKLAIGEGYVFSPVALEVLDNNLIFQN